MTEKSIATKNPTSFEGFDLSPLFTDKEARQVEKINKNADVARRMAIGILSRPKERLVELCKDAETSGGVIDAMEDAQKRYKEINEMLEKACLRLLTAGCIAKGIGFEDVFSSEGRGHE